MKKKSKKVLLIVLASIFTVVAILIISAFLFLMGGQDKIKSMQIENVSIQDVPNGTYTGTFNGNRWSNTLEVTVNDGKITDIKVVKDQKISVPEVTDTLFQTVKRTQTLQVDVVTGATVTSKAYLKAIEYALKSK